MLCEFKPHPFRQNIWKIAPMEVIGLENRASRKAESSILLSSANLTTTPFTKLVCVIGLFISKNVPHQAIRAEMSCSYFCFSYFIFISFHFISFILLKLLISLFHYSLYDKSPCSKERGFYFACNLRF